MADKTAFSIDKPVYNTGKQALLGAAAMALPALLMGGNPLSAGITGAAMGYSGAKGYNQKAASFLQQREALANHPNFAPMADIINSFTTPEQIQKAQAEIMGMTPQGTPGQFQEIYRGSGENYQPHITNNNVLDAQPQYPKYQQKPVPINSRVQNGIADLSPANYSQPIQGSLVAQSAPNNMFMTNAQKMAFEQSPNWNPSARNNQANAEKQEYINTRQSEITDSEINNRNARTDYLNTGNRFILGAMAGQKDDLTKKLEYLTNPKNRQAVEAQGYDKDSLAYEIKSIQQQITSLDHQIYNQAGMAQQNPEIGTGNLSPQAQSLIQKYGK